MDLVNRAKNIIASPAREWDQIRTETPDTNRIITGYVIPLAGAAALAAFIGYGFIGINVWGYRAVGVSWGLYQALSVFKGKSISDVLDLTVEEAVAFFQSIPFIYRKIKVLQDVGLGYITLGQSAVTLSGGEAQRVKLATELAKKDTGKTFYILDEPTTGLHFEDIHHLLEVLNKLVDRGNTVLVIEHNLDVIKVADHIIDLGPEGGSGGGRILFAGLPEEMVGVKESFTAHFLNEELKSRQQSV